MSENIVFHPVENEMKQSYIDYAMSVIISRALPDVRDGLKPVQRRILYAMYDMKLFHNARFKKSAWVVWEVLGKYHPHGDSSVYEAMVRMAQPFSLRYPLVHWQGNFGSIDGDGAAAMRYTEAKLTNIAEEMLEDLEKDTVLWADNYDSTRKEPKTLSTKFPMSLCNGTIGIAVGMATNMPPHNLVEVIDALCYLMSNPECTVDDIMEIVKWPDFPLWWIIFNSNAIKEVYRHGKWSIVARWRVKIKSDNGINTIVVDQIPYQVNKATMVARIWQLTQEWKIVWIKDIVDASSKNKIEILITVKAWVDPKDVLTKLYKLTELQNNFSINNVILTEKWLQPKLLNIKDILQEFVDFRREVVYKRSMFLLKKAQDRLHILEWLKKAIDIIDDVIAAIRWSETRQEAKEQLMAKFEFSSEQAEYILLLRLQTLVGLEIKRILDEIAEKLKDIEYLKWIVENKEKLDWVVVDELNYIKDTYWDKRRTQVEENESVYNLDASIRDLKKREDFIKEPVLVWKWLENDIRILYQSRVTVLPTDTAKLYETDNQVRLFYITERWFFCNPRVKDLPASNIKGLILSIKEFHLRWKIIYLEPTDQVWDYVIMLTNQNNIKKINKKDLWKITKTLNIMKLEKWEKIIKVISVNKWDNVWIISKQWNWVLYSSDRIRPMWRLSWWIKAMGLDKWEAVADAFVYHEDMYIVMFTNKWWWKMIMAEELKIQRRWWKWLIYSKLSNGEYITCAINKDEWHIVLELTNWKYKKIKIDDVPLKNTLSKMGALLDEEIVGIKVVVD